MSAPARARRRHTPIREWLLTIGHSGPNLNSSRYMRIPDFVTNREAAMMYDRMNWAPPPSREDSIETDSIIIEDSSDSSSEEEETADDKTFIDDSNVTKADTDALETLQRGLKRAREDTGPDCNPDM